jgi:signal transduction histidine kinase/CheY-like chemotaxis protein
MPADLSPSALRVLIFAPIGRDAKLTADLLERAQLSCHLCRSIAEVCEATTEGAGAIVMTEEALSDPRIADLGAVLADQPAWSDIPVLLFAGDIRADASLRTLRMLEVLRNVTLLDRPLRIAAVISTIQSAIRSRQRQYELRDVLVALHSARTEAEQANRLKDEFLATLSHELRTPLNAILGWVSMLRQSQVPKQRVARTLEIVERNAHAQAQLIADVLDVSRMITGQIRLQVSPQPLWRILADVVDSVRPAIEAKDIRLVVAEPADWAWVEADPQRLQQIFWNLLSNAVKFTATGGRLEVAVERGDGMVEVAITDTGIGLSPEFLPFVFDRFRQADQTFTRSHGGLGLGLAIVKHLVEMHGGTVSVTSPGLGGGSTFRVRLPLSTEPATLDLELAAAVDAPPPAELHRALVLVVDDDPSTRELLVTVLTYCHARVVAADSAKAAISALDREVPAVMVADIGMPEEDGLSLMRRVRARPPERGGGVPSIALSAYARSEDQLAARAAGFNEFISKPAIPAEVARAVERCMTSSR